MNCSFIRTDREGTFQFPEWCLQFLKKYSLSISCVFKCYFSGGFCNGVLKLSFFKGSTKTLLSLPFCNEEASFNHCVFPL